MTRFLFDLAIQETHTKLLQYIKQGSYSLRPIPDIFVIAPNLLLRVLKKMFSYGIKRNGTYFVVVRKQKVTFIKKYPPPPPKKKRASIPQWPE